MYIEGRIWQSKEGLAKVYSEIIFRRNNSGNGNGNGDGNANWGWDSLYKGEKPNILKIVEVVLKEKIPSYGLFLGHCVTCGMLYVKHSDPTSLDFFRNLNGSQTAAIRKVKDVCNSVVCPPISTEALSDNGITETTGGICKFCQDCSRIGEGQRKEQREEGSFDCFGKSLRFCDRFDCSRRDHQYKVNRFGEDKPGCLPMPEQAEEYPLWLYRTLKFREFGVHYPYKVIYRG